MSKISATTTDQHDPFDLMRFINAQETIYEQACAELRSGRKRAHWMWFIFPQLDGLGYSSTAKHYAIKSLEEARHYLHHPVLGERLLTSAAILLEIEGRSAGDIFGSPDDLKLKSSMTLFEVVSEADSVFARVLDIYFNGQRDSKTLTLLQ